MNRGDVTDYILSTFPLIITINMCVTLFNICSRKINQLRQTSVNSMFSVPRKNCNKNQFSTIVQYETLVWYCCLW